MSHDVSCWGCPAVMSHILNIAPAVFTFAGWNASSLTCTFSNIEIEIGKNHETKRSHSFWPSQFDGFGLCCGTLAINLLSCPMLPACSIYISNPSSVALLCTYLHLCGEHHCGIVHFFRADWSAHADRTSIATPNPEFSNEFFHTSVMAPRSQIHALARRQCLRSQACQNKAQSFETFQVTHPATQQLSDSKQRNRFKSFNFIEDPPCWMNGCVVNSTRLLLVRQSPEKFKSEERLQHSPGASQLCLESLESTNSQASISIESKRTSLKSPSNASHPPCTCRKIASSGSSIRAETVMLFCIRSMSTCLLTLQTMLTVLPNSRKETLIRFWTKEAFIRSDHSLVTFTL